MTKVRIKPRLILGLLRSSTYVICFVCPIIFTANLSALDLLGKVNTLRLLLQCYGTVQLCVRTRTSDQTYFLSGKSRFLKVNPNSFFPVLKMPSFAQKKTAGHTQLLIACSTIYRAPTYFTCSSFLLLPFASFSFENIKHRTVSLFGCQNIYLFLSKFKSILKFDSSGRTRSLSFSLLLSDSQIQTGFSEEL